MTRCLCLLLCSCAAALLAGAAVTGPVPERAGEADRAHAAIHDRLHLATVGLTCEAPRGRYYGTGAVVSADGLVLSNITVIPRGARAIKVYFPDGRVRPAGVVRSDPRSEGVLLRIPDADGLVHYELARSDECRVGDPVYAWGNPHGTIAQDGGVSLSTGGISGIYETASVDDQSRYVGRVIEVDAAVNPGSDGGPITDAEGRLIGIMSLAFSPTRWMGLAIPTDVLVDGLPELEEVERHPPARADADGIWARRAAMQRAAGAVAPAVVGLWVRRAGDPEDPPTARDEQALELRIPYRRRNSPDRRPDEEPPSGHAAMERRRPPVHVASGVVVDPSGTLITAAWNLRPGDDDPDTPRPIEEILVYLADGSRYRAEVLGLQPVLDLAVLQIVDLDEEAAIVALDLRKAGSRSPPQGSTVAVLGRSEPPGTATLNVGRVSATRRMRGRALQVDALVNYGNLGGPVIDAASRLVGIATHLDDESAWRQNCGVGFCLEVGEIRDALPRLRRGEELEIRGRPLVGFQVDFDYRGRGVRIERLLPGKPAQLVGMAPGDVIVGIDGHEVPDFVTFQHLLEDYEPGQEVRILVRRGIEKRKVELTLAEAAW